MKISRGLGAVCLSTVLAVSVTGCGFEAGSKDADAKSTVQGIENNVGRFCDGSNMIYGGGKSIALVANSPDCKGVVAKGDPKSAPVKLEFSFEKFCAGGDLVYHGFETLAVSPADPQCKKS